MLVFILVLLSLVLIGSNVLHKTGHDEDGAAMGPVHESDNPFLRQPLGCMDLARIKGFHPFAHGQKKEVMKGELHGGVDGSDKQAPPIPVVLARPFNGDFWTGNTKGYAIPSLRTHYESYFRNERSLLAALESEYAPHFYGGCWSSFRSTILVEEYLRGFMDAAADPRTTFDQRLMIAAGAVRMLDLWDRFPLLNGTVARGIYGDLFAKQFALDAEMNVKVVDVQSFMAYNPALPGFGADYTCYTDADCENQYWRTPGKPHVMRGLRDLGFDDFGCTKHHRCRGLDSHTTLAAVCLLLIDPLFELAPTTGPGAPTKTQRDAVYALLNSCMQPKRDERPPASEILRRFEMHTGSVHKVPPLNLSNADLSEYAATKDRFEDIRRRRSALVGAQIKKDMKAAAKAKGKGKGKA